MTNEPSRGRPKNPGVRAYFYLAATGVVEAADGFGFDLPARRLAQRPTSWFSRQLISLLLGIAPRSPSAVITLRRPSALMCSQPEPGESTSDLRRLPCRSFRAKPIRAVRQRWRFARLT
jgi:hypothetical protein